MIQKLMGTWLRNNSRQPFHKLQQSNLNGARPIRPRCLQQYSIFPFPIRNQSILRQWGAQYTDTKPLILFGSLPTPAPHHVDYTHQHWHIVWEAEIPCKCFDFSSSSSSNTGIISFLEESGDIKIDGIQFF